ncbi:MAG: hypothetical protein IT318_23995 [Anaerolineales bacterium]|nr:hypothetical protein [Anaerolineales bacterium]
MADTLSPQSPTTEPPPADHAYAGPVARTLNVACLSGLADLTGHTNRYVPLPEVRRFLACELLHEREQFQRLEHTYGHRDAVIDYWRREYHAWTRAQRHMAIALCWDLSQLCAAYQARTGGAR